MDKKEAGFRIDQFPEADDRGGWTKFTEEADNFVSQHAQTGEKGYSTFGEDIAISAMRRFLDSTRRMDKLQNLSGDTPTPKVILENEKNLLEKKASKLGEINHEDILRLRTILSKLPLNIRHQQNQIFTNLMNEDSSKFLLNTLAPNVVMLKKPNDAATLLERALFMRREQRVWYDFIGKLTERDEDGNPTVSDETFQNFFEWYQSNLAKRQHELNIEAPDNIARYSDNVKKAVNEGHLPESLADNLEFFDPDSPRACNLNFSLFDMMGNGSSASGSYTNLRIDKEAPISIRADAAVGYDKYKIIWHELTHAISGDTFDFGNEEANRIVEEALTEHISHMIFSSEEGTHLDGDEFDFMSGKAYKKERNVVKWLASGGVKTISPQMFYEAYAEYDHNYEKNHDEWLYGGKEEYPKPEIGPKKEALYSALLEAFPDCKDTNDLGKMITEKFIEISQNSAH